MKQHGRSARSLVAVSVILSVAAAQGHSSQQVEIATTVAFTEGPAADRDGNVYFTDIINQRIFPIAEDFITNNAFGGPDMRTLYVTAGKTLYKLRTDIPGLPR